MEHAIACLSRTEAPAASLLVLANTLNGALLKKHFWDGPPTAARHQGEQRLVVDCETVPYNVAVFDHELDFGSQHDHVICTLARLSDFQYLKPMSLENALDNKNHRFQMSLRRVID